MYMLWLIFRFFSVGLIEDLTWASHNSAFHFSQILYFNLRPDTKELMIYNLHFIVKYIIVNWDMSGL